MSDPYKAINNSVRKDYERLAADGLIGKDLAPSFITLEMQEERGFQCFQNDTLTPEVVNRHIAEIGEDVK